jgi:hypothetical protein
MNLGQERLLKEYFDDMLDDCYPEFEIFGMHYSPSVVLERIDPIAYQVSMNDYESVLREEYEDNGAYSELFMEEGED